jgi:hypothetical protein
MDKAMKSLENVSDGFSSPWSFSIEATKSALSVESGAIW